MPGFPPYSEDSLSFYFNGVRKGFLSPETEFDVDVPEEMTEPFEQGVRDGENYGAYGYPLDIACVDLREEESDSVRYSHLAHDVYDVTTIGMELWKGKFLGGALEGGILLLMLAITLPVHYSIPSEAIDTTQVQSFAEFIRDIPEPLSMSIYYGGGIDYDDPNGCHLQMTRVYKSADAARAELQAMGRPAGVLMSQRTDMSGGPEQIEQYGEIIN